MRGLLAAILLPAALALPARAEAQAVAFQADAAHTGFAHDPKLKPPLRRAWTRSFEGAPSYAVIAEGKVFVIARTRGRSGVWLHALSARTGRTVWSTPAGGGGLAYDQGRIYVTRETYSHPGGLAAHSAADGRLLWETPAPGSGGPLPVAADGVVYVTGLGGGSGLSAHRGSDGGVLWDVPTDSSGKGAPAVGPDAVYASFSCPNLYAVRRSDGAPLWDTAAGCYSPSGMTPVLHGGRLYVRDYDERPPGAVYDPATGAALAPMPADLPPAFGGGLGLFPEARLPGETTVEFGHTLVARSLSTARVRWRFRGDGYLDTAPLIVDRTAYVGSGSGRLYALSLDRGRVLWRTDAGRGIAGSYEHRDVVSGLAAGEGLLVVPAFGRLVAFRSR